MASLDECFAALRAKGEKALIPFVTGGDPSIEELPAILQALVEAGADAIEVGIPFSDPVADGPTIQAASQRALDRGATPAQVLEAVGMAGVDVPIVYMGYLNPMLRMGLATFARRVHESGASGVIVCDLSPEEADEWVDAATAQSVDRVFLAAPTSTDERLQMVCARASGFVYAISRTGVTGAGQEAPPEVTDLVARIRRKTDLPVCVGFGISKPEHVKMVCRASNGAVVGSWLVDLLAREWKGGAGRSMVIEQVRALKAATRA